MFESLKGVMMMMMMMMMNARKHAYDCQSLIVLSSEPLMRVPSARQARHETGSVCPFSAATQFPLSSHTRITLSLDPDAKFPPGIVTSARTGPM